MRNRSETGMALITALLVMMLLSTMIVGLAWLVTSDVKLGGNNSDRQMAFYGAEAGMEALTTSLENTFSFNVAPNAATVNGLATGMPATVAPTGIQFLAPGNNTVNSGLSITFNKDGSGNPKSGWSTIPPGGPYAGMIGLLTPYTLQVTARSVYGSEVRLQREVQTVAIPVFQFGVFCQYDCGFHAGQNFTFGGRAHSNGNLWLAEVSGNTLTMSDKVDAAGEIITANLMNGLVTATGGYAGAVKITNGSAYQDLTQKNPSQSITGAANFIGNIGPEVVGNGWQTTTNSYAGYLNSKATGAKTLNLAIATPGLNGQEIDLIRRPIPGQDATPNGLTKLEEQDYWQANMRILLSDYGPSGGCTDSDISSASAAPLPDTSPNMANSPVDIGRLAWDPSSGGAGPPYNTAPGWLTALYGPQLGVTIFPMPVSAPTQAGASPATTNGYWVQQYYPIDSGCIKIDYQIPAGGTWVDMTTTILGKGFTGRNINPQIGTHNVPAYTFATPEPQPSLSSEDIANQQVAAQGPTANGAVTMIGCSDPSPNAIIRLARLRDNPSNAAVGNDYCGNTPSVGTWSGKASNNTVCTVAGVGGAGTTNCPSQHGADYWPNVIFDTREGLLRDVALPDFALGSPRLTLAGAMHYVELDMANVAAWFAANNALVYSTNGFSVYFSDRRGNQPDNSPAPTSAGGGTIKTGGFGYEDIVNNVSDPANGCPNGALDQGEDLEGDYTNGIDATPILRMYGGTPTMNNNENNAGTVVPMANITGAASTVLSNNPNCAGPLKTWPYAVANNSEDLRNNPPLLFRRALKLVHADTLATGTCNSVPCGLTVVSENPVYIQGDFNNPGLNTGFTGAAVGASVLADAVTILSDNWNDVNSFISANSPAGRGPVTTTYRLGIAAGKSIAFKNTEPAVNGDFGDDGGVHNFMHYLENWGNGSQIYYLGSFVSMFYSHQGYGTYKCCNTVYGVPVRNYTFDSNFLTPSLLPPLTPMMRTLNTTGFTQLILPTQ